MSRRSSPTKGYFIGTSQSPFGAHRQVRDCRQYSHYLGGYVNIAFSFAVRKVSPIGTRLGACDIGSKEPSGRSRYQRPAAGGQASSRREQPLHFVDEVTQVERLRQDFRLARRIVVRV